MTPPPADWIAKTFAPHGQVTYCQDCRAVPFAAMGSRHACDGLSQAEVELTGRGGQWITEPVDLTRLRVTENPARPGEWRGLYRREGRHD